MLCKDPATRITVEQALKHPFFKQKTQNKLIPGFVTEIEAQTKELYLQTMTPVLKNAKLPVKPSKRGDSSSEDDIENVEIIE